MPRLGGSDLGEKRGSGRRGISLEAASTGRRRSRARHGEASAAGDAAPLSPPTPPPRARTGRIVEVRGQGSRGSGRARRASRAQRNARVHAGRDPRRVPKGVADDASGQGRGIHRTLHPRGRGVRGPSTRQPPRRRRVRRRRRRRRSRSRRRRSRRRDVAMGRRRSPSPSSSSSSSRRRRRRRRRSFVPPSKLRRVRALQGRVGRRGRRRRRRRRRRRVGGRPVGLADGKEEGGGVPSRRIRRGRRAGVIAQMVRTGTRIRVAGRGTKRNDKRRGQRR